MPFPKKLNNVVDNIVYSYEARIRSIGSIFETAHQILQGFQDALLDTKKEREKVSSELQEHLAKNESLRRKDFDNMMQGILSAQNEREKEVRNLLNRYFNEQIETTQALRESLERFKESIAKGEAKRLKGFQEMIKKILSKQEERKEEITSRLKEFQKEQQLLAARLKELLAKGKELRIRDFKSMLKKFNAQRKELISHQEERREMVHDLLEAFKTKRIEAVESWRFGQKKMSERRNNSSKIIHSVRNKEF